MSSNLVIVGIDPGTVRCGIGVVARRGNRYVHLAHEVASAPSGAPLADRLARIGDRIEAVLLAHTPDAVAIERAFFHRDVHAALMIGHARGAAMLIAGRLHLPVGEHAPASVKRAVVGTGKADKVQVQRMIQAILGLAEPPPTDAADALAVAICHASTIPVAATSSLRTLRR